MRDEPPRPLTRLPVEITQHEIFKHQELPLVVCEFCDGDALEYALATNRERMA